MADIIPWIATAATILAAFLTAANLGSRITGYGFAVFLVGSIAWLTDGLITAQPALTWTNVVLTGLNIFGIWRWLGRQARVEEGANKAAEASEAVIGETLFPVSLLTRAPFRSKGGKELGTCVDAMAGCEGGAIKYVVVSTGGVAGVGETLRRVDWSGTRVDGETFQANLSFDAFAQLQELPRDQWPAR